MVVCPRCHSQSSGRFFCDRCHTLLPSIPQAALPDVVQLPDGRVIDCSAWHGTWPADAWRPIRVLCGDTACRVYALNRSWWPDLAAAIEERAAVSLPSLAPIHIVAVEEGAVVIAQAPPGATRPLTTAPPFADELERLEDTVAVCRTLARALEPLHASGWVWLNFDPAAFEVAGGTVQITNLDLRLFSFGASPDGLRLSTAYAPPEAAGFVSGQIGPATDVFHVSLYAYHRLAGLLPNGFPGQGLEAFSFEVPPLRIYRPGLPVGVEPVLRRGLDRDPVWRYPRLSALLESLEEALTQARQRSAWSGGVVFDTGSASVIGRAHAAEGRANQDACTLFSLAPDRLVTIVADGVTHARVGSGEQASQTAIAILAGHLAHLEEQDIPTVLTTGCLAASQAILDQAAALLPAGDTDPNDLMSSTAVVGVFDHHVLHLACAGDSRAFLLTSNHAEQLTVDGNVRCIDLAAGMPPEEVVALGPDAQALYRCLGVAELGPAGELVVSAERNRPVLSRWPLLPGDIVLLCSDGVIEEGVFLEPAEVPALVADAGPSAAQIAQHLIDAACARHRDPSSWEPAGCGDDATCIVIRVLPGPAR